MTRDPDRRRDEDAFRPRGEATREPDHVLEQDEEPRDQLASTDYPGSVQASSTCPECGPSVPPTSERCASCRREHAASKTPIQQGEETELEFLHLVFTLVPARTEYAALAKGTAAHSLLVTKGDTAIHECELVADGDGSPSRTLTNHWGSLPDVVQVESDVGERLLHQACDRTQWEDDADSGGHPTYLYDHAGDAINSRQRLTAVREQAADPLWLVPALALQQPSRPDDTGQRSSATPTRQTLMCRRCERETRHRFHGTETSPADQWAGQPIWDCRVCGTSRHGPNPS
ncbi:biosurfactant protein 1 [Halarchaeum acidiphilum]